MPSPETGSSTPLFDLSTMRAENGPSLSVARNLFRSPELQSLFALPHLHDVILLGVFRRHDGLDLERSVERWTVQRHIDARELSCVERHERDIRISSDGVHGVALFPGVTEPDDDRGVGENEVSNGMENDDAATGTTPAAPTGVERGVC